MSTNDHSKVDVENALQQNVIEEDNMKIYSNEKCSKAESSDKTNINEVNEELNNKLLEAAEAGNADFVTKLVCEGADIEWKNGSGDTSAHLAAMGGHDAVLTILLDIGVMVNTRGNGDHTPLMLAATKGFSHTSTVKLLHSRGADLNLQNQYGWTALMLTAAYGRLETAAQLLVLGADIDLQSKRGNAEQCAKHSGHHDVASLLNTWTQHKEIDKVMFHCAEVGNQKAVEALITLGGNIQYTYRRDTGYHKAAENGHLSVVRTYLQHGIEVDFRGRFGYTALIHAAEFGKLGIVCELLEWGADAKLQDKDGGTAQKYSDRYGHHAISLVLGTGIIDPEEVGQKKYY